MSTDGSGASGCCKWALFGRIDDEIEGVDETGGRGPSAATEVGLANLARLLAAEETRVSYETLDGKGRSAGGKEDGGGTGEEAPIIAAGSKTGLLMVGARGGSSPTP
jgi:hypothetical protein